MNSDHILMNILTISYYSNVCEIQVRINNSLLQIYIHKTQVSMLVVNLITNKLFLCIYTYIYIHFFIYN